MRSKGTVLFCSPQCTGGAAGDRLVESKEECAGLLPAAWHHHFQVSHEATSFEELKPKRKVSEAMPLPHYALQQHTCSAEKLPGLCWC